MRSLIIADVSPMLASDGAHRGSKRRDLFISAICSISDEVEVAFYASADGIAALGALAPHEAMLSDAWGLPVRLNPIPDRSRQATIWNHYVTGAFSAAEQQGYQAFSGPDQVRGVARSLEREPDLVLASRFQAACALPHARMRTTRFFFDMMDIEHKIRLRTVLSAPVRAGTPLYMAQIPALLLAERRVVRMAEATFVCSEQDQQHLRRLGFGGRIEVIPNAMPIPAQAAPATQEPTVLYLGTYSYMPNREAADRLIRHIWPLIRQEVPEARLIIAGKGPERIPSFGSAGPGVAFTGFVDDLDQLYGRSRVVACPIMVGGGTRLKLVEAASYGRPMVSTRIGAEGLHFAAEQEILLRDDDAGFARACRPTPAATGPGRCRAAGSETATTRPPRTRPPRRRSQRGRWSATPPPAALQA